MSNSSSQLICPSYSLSLRVNARIISARRQASLANAGSLITRRDPTCNFRRVLLASRFQARDRISDTGLSLAGNFIMHILARHQVRVLDLRSLSARALAANNSLVVRRKYAMRSATNEAQSQCPEPKPSRSTSGNWIRSRHRPTAAPARDALRSERRL